MDIIRQPKKDTPPVYREGYFSLGESAPLKVSSPQTGHSTLPTKLKTSSKTFVWIASLFLFLIICATGFYFFAGVTLTNSLHFENRELSFFDSLRAVSKSFFQKSPVLLGETNGRINILLLGRAGEKYPGKNLTDTIMVMSIDTKRNEVALLSLPRDLFVPIVGTNTSTKINALYQYGISSNVGTKLIRESIEHITGLPLHYSAVIDFDGFEKVIDALGGVRIEVLRDIYDTRYPGKNYSYETFELKAGWQKLDGKTALKYARERHDDPEGDFGRAKRQQQLIQSVSEKALSLPTFLNPFTLHGFLENLGESITTDVAPEEIRSFIELGKRLDTRNIETVVIDAWKKESLLRVDHLDTASGRAFILVPRSGTWDELRTVTAGLFEWEEGRIIKEKMASEKATLTLIGKPTNRAALQSLARSLRDEFPALTVRESLVSALEKEPETAIIQVNGELSKPYTLDALIKRYILEKTASLPVDALSVKDQSSDFTLIYTQKTFTDSPTQTELPLDQSTYDFQEPLPPQPAKR